jgi:bifunctional non-homologous end joining protein LigD
MVGPRSRYLGMCGRQGRCRSLSCTGTLMINYRGHFEMLGGTVEAGELKFVLHGKRLRGERHLVRTKGDGGPWPLFKARDRYAQGGEVQHGARQNSDTKQKGLADRKNKAPPLAPASANPRSTCVPNSPVGPPATPNRPGSLNGLTSAPQSTRSPTRHALPPSAPHQHRC